MHYKVTTFRPLPYRDTVIVKLWQIWQAFRGVFIYVSIGARSVKIHHETLELWPKIKWHVCTP